jgi:hypothetical protein
MASSPVGSKPSGQARLVPDGSKSAGVTVDHVKLIFPTYSQKNIKNGYEIIEAEFERQVNRLAVNGTKLTGDQVESLRHFTYATVRAENEKFLPKYDETSNQSNTSSPGSANMTLFKYEYLNPGDFVKVPYNKYYRRSLGNESLYDAQTYHGRGYVQLTGKENYSHYCAQAGIPGLVENPDLASSSNNAAKLLVAYILDKRNRQRILDALADNQLSEARRAVNGGLNGLNQFSRAYKTLKSEYVKQLEGNDPGLRDRVQQQLVNSDSHVPPA